jgi:hypothetical protein
VFVVRKDPSLTVEELQEFCRQNFTGYKKTEVHRVPRTSCRRPTSARSCAANCAMQAQRQTPDPLNWCVPRQPERGASVYCPVNCGGRRAVNAWHGLARDLRVQEGRDSTSAT